MDKESFINLSNKYFHLISLYLHKKKDDDFKVNEDELKFFISLSTHHSLTALLYKALLETSTDVDPKYLKKLEQHYLANIRKMVLFEQERKELYKYLNDNQIDFLPLKGIVIKDYYPDVNAREFADNDILFKGKDKLIKKYFVDHGYIVELFKKSNHDVYLKKPCLNYEMHRSLFGETGDNEHIVQYFSNYMDKAPIKEGYEHYLSLEDFYIYFTAHTYKHFHIAGCGIRTLVDYYLFLNANKLDYAYVDEELKKLGLLDFSKEISTLSMKLFDEVPLDDKEKEILLFISSSGTYGTLENRVEKGIKEKGRFKYFISRIFPPYRFYKTAYPWAYKTVILIPIAWMMRCIRVLFKNPRSAAKEIKLISKSKEKEK